MENTIQTNVINYVDANGKLVFNATVQTVQVRNEADLAQLTGMGTGTRAYLTDESKMWVLGANGQWSLKANGGEEEESHDVMIATFTIGSNDELTCDKTTEELGAAITAGTPILGAFYGMTALFDNDTFNFIGIDSTNLLLHKTVVSYDDQNGWTYAGESYTLTEST